MKSASAEHAPAVIARARRALAEGDDAAIRRRFEAPLLEDRQQARLDQCQLRLDEREHARHLGRVAARVEIGEDGAGARGAVEGNAVFRQVRAHDGHDVALADAVADQRLGEAVRGGVEARIIEPLVPAEDRRLARQPPCRASQDIARQQHVRDTLPRDRFLPRILVAGRRTDKADQPTPSLICSGRKPTPISRAGRRRSQGQRARRRTGQGAATGRSPESTGPTTLFCRKIWSR